MERPQYANAFSVTYNAKLNEVVINFVHEYQVFETPVDTAQGKIPIKPLTHQTDVCSVVLPGEIASQLRGILGKSMQQNDE
jgi:hypothetical protein